MPRVGKTKSNAEPVTVIPEAQLSQQDCPPTAGELTTANADVEFPPNIHCATTSVDTLINVCSTSPA